MKDRRYKTPCVYILASAPNGILYTGVTSDLTSRMYEHVTGTFDGFTKKYAVHMLVYYEVHDNMDAAIVREDRVKDWKRTWKIRLILGFNPMWVDLYNHDMGTIAPGPADDERER